jgi:hypothetical protein
MLFREALLLQTVAFGIIEQPLLKIFGTAAS